MKMMLKSEKEKKIVEKALKEAEEMVDKGDTGYHGATYEDGVVVALSWVLGKYKKPPMQEEE